jgi:hypothetical protein
MKLSKEKRDRLVLVLIVGLMAAVGTWQLLIKSSLSQLSRTRQSGEAALKKLQDAEAFLRRSQAFEGQAESLSARIAALEGEMASPTDPYSWGYQLMERARAGHEVEISEVARPQPASAVQLIPDFPYQAVRFGVQGRAHYDALGRFLADFENRHPFFQTVNLQLTPGRPAETAAASSAPTRGGGDEKLAFRFEVVALVKPGS